MACQLSAASIIRNLVEARGTTYTISPRGTDCARRNCANSKAEASRAPCLSRVPDTTCRCALGDGRHHQDDGQSVQRG